MPATLKSWEKITIDEARLEASVKQCLPTLTKTTVVQTRYNSQKLSHRLNTQGLDTT